MRQILTVLLVVCAAGGILAKSKKNASSDKLKVAVYYEALCSDSKSFVIQQLYPAWQNLHDAIRVKLVPYGKAIHNKNKDGKWEFDCQHGPRECYGNKIQGCVLRSKELTDGQKFDLIRCLMADRNPDMALQQCAGVVNVDASAIESCANGTMGDEILASYGDKTHQLNFNLAFVPTVIFNEKFNQADQDAAMSDLKGVICRLSTKKPMACP
nr:gamma-interferon-inducible lysosomal thiol reductase-like protein [Limnephilus flavicornis]